MTINEPNNSKDKLDYKSKNKKYINSAMNSETYSSVEGLPSDNEVISVKICLNLQKNKKKKKNR